MWLGAPKGANSIAASGLGSEMDLVDTRRAVSILLEINGVKTSHLTL